MALKDGRTIIILGVIGRKARQNWRKKSEEVSQALKDLRERRIELLLREGYEERAEHGRRLLKRVRAR